MDEVERIAASQDARGAAEIVWQELGPFRMGTVAALTDHFARFEAHLRSTSPAGEAGEMALIRSVIEEAEQACRYVAKHNSDRQDAGEYRDGFEAACEVCEKAIAPHVERHKRRLAASDTEAMRQARGAMVSAMAHRYGDWVSILEEAVAHIDALLAKGGAA